MQLRDHPLLSYKSFSSWPPVWAWIDLKEDKHPHGEVGVLKAVHADQELRRCFLTIEYEKQRYMGCLFVSDRAFCRQLAMILERHLGSALKQIGDLDLSHTL